LTFDPGAEIVTKTGQIKAVNKFIHLESILEATGATTLEIERKKTYVPGFSPKYFTICGRNMDTKHTTGKQITGN
jgi:hypothetical protein